MEQKIEDIMSKIEKVSQETRKCSIDNFIAEVNEKYHIELERDIVEKFYNQMNNLFYDFLVYGQEVQVRKILDNFKNRFDILIYDNLSDYNRCVEELIDIYQMNYYNDEIEEFLFEKYLEYDDDFRKSNVLNCVHRTNDYQKWTNLNNVYAMLRLAFESKSSEQQEQAISIIEDVRDKVCLQIIIDTLNFDYIDFPLLINYITKVKKELEDELCC